MNAARQIALDRRRLRLRVSANVVFDELLTVGNTHGGKTVWTEEPVFCCAVWERNVRNGAVVVGPLHEEELVDGLGTEIREDDWAFLDMPKSFCGKADAGVGEERVYGGIERVRFDGVRVHRRRPHVRLFCEVAVQSEEQNAVCRAEDD